MDSVCSLPDSPNHVLAITRGSQDTSRSRYRSRSIKIPRCFFPALRIFFFLFFPRFSPRSNPFGNWRQRWNRRHGNRFHISTVVIATIKLDDTFFSSLPPVLSIYARSSRRRTETRTDRAAPLVCTRRFPLAMSKDSKKFSISNRVDNRVKR